MIKLGIMQSRLAPIDTSKKYQYCPTNWWLEEFQVARANGYAAVEWIYDNVNDNPLNHPDGYKAILKECLANNIRIDAICADYFVDHPFWDDKQATMNISVLNNLIVNAFKLGVKNIVIPCLDNSAFPHSTFTANFRRNIQPCLDIAGRYVVNLCLETDLRVVDLKHLLESIPNQRFGLCYDTGNSAAKGYSPTVEFAMYGERVLHVHLKDCPLHGRNIEIGKGDTKFEEVFELLAIYKYDGPYTLQCARAKSFDLSYIDKQKSKIEELYGVSVKR